VVRPAKELLWRGLLPVTPTGSDEGGDCRTDNGGDNGLRAAV